MSDFNFVAVDLSGAPIVDASGRRLGVRDARLVKVARPLNRGTGPGTHRAMARWRASAA